MALNSLHCAEVPLRNFSLSHDLLFLSESWASCFSLYISVNLYVIANC